MSATFFVLLVAAYFLTLFIISFFTGKNEDNNSFFLGNRKSPWFVVAFGMIGTSLSGVTFISVPGSVEANMFSYMQVVVGYFIGYMVIANVLLPLYYRLNLTSIYTYLEQRFGVVSYKTGAFFFLLSRTLGAAFRLFIVASVFQIGIFDRLDIHVPFAVTVAITIGLIWLYTFRSGIKTIIWTDTLQTFFMLLAVVVTIVVIGQEFDLGPGGLVQKIRESEYSKWLFTDDWSSPKHVVKQVLSGAFLAIVMTGLDQDMMQKNLSCRSLKDAKKNMYWFSSVLVVVNLLFLSLGALLYLFAAEKGIALPEGADKLYTTIALDGHLGILVAVFFILGLIAAAYSSADSALTALTTSFCVDFLNIEKKEDQRKQVNIRKWVHIGFSVLLAGVIILFKYLGDKSIIDQLLKAAGYTYGPLLGLFAFGLFTKRRLMDSGVWVVCLASPVYSFFLNWLFENYDLGYKFGFEILLINGLITFSGLLVLSSPPPPEYPEVLDNTTTT